MWDYSSSVSIFAEQLQVNSNEPVMGVASTSTSPGMAPQLDDADISHNIHDEVILPTTHVLGSVPKLDEEPVETDATVAPLAPEDKWPTLAELSHWEQSEQQIRYDVALGMALPVAQVESSFRSSVLLRDVRRYAVRTEGDKQVEVGVAVRLVVTVWGTDLSGKLTLPIVAAKAELGVINASVRIGIVGYPDNAIFGLFPDFKEINVESYARYVAATDAIRKYIGKHPEGIRPEELRRSDNITDTDTPIWQAIGVVRALKRIDKGQAQDEATEGISQYPVLLDGVNQAYNVLAPDLDSGSRPNEYASDKARTFLNYT